MTTVCGHISGARARLRDAGISRDEAACDAEFLARTVLGWDRTTYLARSGTEAPLGFVQRYDAALARREQREPVSLITGHKEFWGLEFDVTPDVLTPRPETELLLEEALCHLPRLAATPSHVVDVGTGSGCLAVAIAHERPDTRLSATDVSAAALAVARKNARRHGVEGRISWMCAPFLDGVEGTPDLIVANLPYVPEADLPNLPPEVREFEPRIALDGGADGLAVIRQLVEHARARLVPGGHLVVELGEGQAASLRSHVDKQSRLAYLGVRDDLQGIPRVAIIQCTALNVRPGTGA